jgi:hypothetical protein
VLFICDVRLGRFGGGAVSTMKKKFEKVGASAGGEDGWMRKGVGVEGFLL